MSGCLSILQRYKIQAIHNPLAEYTGNGSVVYQYFKDTKFKQFTTLFTFKTSRCKLFINTSKIQNSSNSQLSCISQISHFCCLSILQRYKIQAIHNGAFENAKMQISCLSILQRYKIQAIHNTYLPILLKNLVVYQYFKDTNFKQITTGKANSYFAIVLFINTSKIQILSKSQPL